VYFPLFPRYGVSKNKETAMSTSAKVVVLVLGIVAVMVLMTGLLIGSVVDQARRSVHFAVYKSRELR
jgi:hypothetical protein